MKKWLPISVDLKIFVVALYVHDRVGLNKKVYLREPQTECKIFTTKRDAKRNKKTNEK